MAKVDVKPELLKWAIQRSGKADEVKARFAVEQWISQEKQPTFKQLEDFSKMTYTPLGYFFLSKPPDELLPIPNYRTVSKKFGEHPSPSLIDTIQTMERRQDWMRNHLIRLGNVPLPYVGCTTIKDDPKAIALLIRETLGLADGWASVWPNWEKALRELIKKIEEIGILVMVNGIVGNNTHRRLSVEEFRGFVMIDDYAPLIFINGADGKAAQMFTLAHELAHVWVGESAIFDLEEMQPADEKVELVCNQIAAEFLIPEQMMRESWIRHQVESTRYQQMAREYKVSELVIARRAQDLNLITKKEFFQFYNERSYFEASQKQKGSSGGDFFATQNLRLGNRFTNAIISDAKSGHTLFQDAYRLTGLNRVTYDKYVTKRDEGGY